MVTIDGYTQSYYWDVDRNNRIIRNSYCMFRDTHHSFYFIPHYLTIGSHVLIALGMDEGLFEIQGIENIIVLGQSIPCWKLYDDNSGSYLWYSIESQLLIKCHTFVTSNDGKTYEIYSTISSINFDLSDDDYNPPEIILTSPSILFDSEVGTFS